ncbi:hypothetical protein L3I77_003717 [Vibrio vulnificus]|nr:hypothetical protein [Vibrio vulnificus]ELH9434894.1 hypothetical protein [Vibrio vulnificus]
MEFHRATDGYEATRKDGQVIRISKSECNKLWVVRYDNDFDGDNTAFAKTKRELVGKENRIELML